MFSEGDSWRRKRKVISQSFNFEFLSSLVNGMSGIVEKQFKEFDGKGGKVMNILQVFETITADIMVQLFFGSDMEGKLIEGEPVAVCISELVGEAYNSSFEPITLIFGIKFLALGLR